MTRYYADSILANRISDLQCFAYARIGDKGHNVDNLAGVGIDKGLVPLLSLIVLDLDDVGEDDVVRVLGKVLEGSRPVVILAANGSLGLSNCVFLG